MPTLKKRSGKTTITLYAQEERQIQGAIETLRFVELNSDEPPKWPGESLSNRLANALASLSGEPKPKQGELIPDDKKKV